MILSMPRIDKVSASHRNSISTASAAGGGARSSSWSAKDDETLIQARAQGMNWNHIAPKHFPAKSPNACRKRHERLMERQNAAEWDGVKLDVLAQAYIEVRREMWSVLAARVGEKWQLVEQKCMEKGLKNLNQASRSAQRKQGTYDHGSQDDSGIGISDLDEDVSPTAGMPGPSETTFAQFQSQAAYPPHQPRVPSISSMLHQPMPYASQYPQQRPHP